MVEYFRIITKFASKTTTMQPIYDTFDIFRFSDFASCENLEDEIMLIDNLDSHKFGDDTYFRNYPIKVTFTASIICLEGCMRFRLNLKEYEIKANDLLFIQFGDFGEFLSMSEDCRIIIAAFNNNNYQPTHNPGLSISLQRIFSSNRICRLEIPMVNECVSIYKLMKSKIAQTDNKYRKGTLQGYVQVLLNNAYYYFETHLKQNLNHNIKSSRKEEIFNKFLAAVQKDYNCHRNITYYAGVLCISPKHLSQVVQQVSGKLAGEWIRDYVMLEAKALLKSRKFTIQQVADQLNFPNQSFFGRYFKQHAGCSPSAYQKEE